MKKKEEYYIPLNSMHPAKTEKQKNGCLKHPKYHVIDLNHAHTKLIITITSKKLSTPDPSIDHRY